MVPYEGNLINCQNLNPKTSIQDIEESSCRFCYKNDEILIYKGTFHNYFQALGRQSYRYLSFQSFTNFLYHRRGTKNVLNLMSSKVA